MKNIRIEKSQHQEFQKEQSQFHSCILNLTNDFLDKFNSVALIYADTVKI